MIVGISGLAGSGKDTLADFLVRDHGFVKLSFADVMKRFAKEVFDFSEEQLWGPSENRNAMDPRYPRQKRDKDGNVVLDTFLSPRYALQTLGTEWGRDCYESVWVDYAIRKARELDSSTGLDYTAQAGSFRAARERIRGVVIPDCRFENEIVAIERAGGKVVRVVRPGSGLGGQAGRHLSEQEMSGIPDDRFSVVVENTGTLDRFRAQVAGLLVLLEK